MRQSDRKPPLPSGRASASLSAASDAASAANASAVMEIVTMRQIWAETARIDRSEQTANNPTWTRRIASPTTLSSWSAFAVGSALAKDRTGWRGLPRNTALKSACVIYWTAFRMIAFGGHNRERNGGEPTAASICRTLSIGDRQNLPPGMVKLRLVVDK